jgi:integrase
MPTLATCVAGAKQSDNSSNIFTVKETAGLYEHMKLEKLLSQHCDLSKIKYREGINQYYIVIHRKQFTANSRENLLMKLYDNFYGAQNRTLTQSFQEWIAWRSDIQTNSKTLRENANEWKCYIADTELANMRTVDIGVEHLEKYFYGVTANFAITSKRLTNIVVVLNGIFKRSVSLKLIPHNPLLDTDMSLFRRRCKPRNTYKDNYTVNERKRILDYLADKNDVYSLAIQLDFYLCVRIGELCSLKYSDVENGLLHINRSMRETYKMDSNMNFRLGGVTNEERIKGNQSTGFRIIPLTDKAQAIVEKTHSLFPDNEYLFMREGRQLIPTTFNEVLKRTCDELGIKYRPSHQIRFTVATMLYDEGVSITKISALLGHADTATTWHYIRKSSPDASTINAMKTLLD